MGLGTFENLDGKMVILDGHFFQVRSDGSVTEAKDDVLSTFAVVTHLKSDVTVNLPICPDLSSLFVQLDRLRHTDNFFFALRVDSTFDYVDSWDV